MNQDDLSTKLAVPDSAGNQTTITRPGYFRGLFLIFGLFVLVASFPFVWNRWVDHNYSADIYSLEEAPADRVAIVYGAAVYRNGRLSPMLQDRVDTAIALYNAGKVERLLFSGDNSSPAYNEPGRMLEYAMSRGVPAGAIQPDYGGWRTYDTCYRARHIFQVESAILVTQEFHLPRALFTCRSLGVEVVGVAADQRSYHPVSLAWSENREFLANMRALADVIIRRPANVLGDPIPIFVE